MNDKEILKGIIEYLNENFNQDSEDYDIFGGARPQVFKYGEHAAVSLWACGAIVCIYDILYFIQEDDGNWFIRNEDAVQDSFSIGWAPSFIKAMERLKDFVKENGNPVYFSGTQTICNYRL